MCEERDDEAIQLCAVTSTGSVTASINRLLSEVEATKHSIYRYAVTSTGSVTA